MANGVAFASGFAIVPCDDPTQARFLRLTFPERGKIILKIGKGDHIVDEWELTQDQLRGLVLDAMPELLR